MSDKSVDRIVGEYATAIVSAYIASHTISTTEISALFVDVVRTLRVLASPVAGLATNPITVAGPYDRCRDAQLTCLEDGRRMKLLKRHLYVSHGMTPEEYRAKWNLSADAPMVASGYAALRSGLAKQHGLGLKRYVSAPRMPR